MVATVDGVAGMVVGTVVVTGIRHAEDPGLGQDLEITETVTESVAG